MKEFFDAHVHYMFEIPLEETISLFKREFEMTKAKKMAFLSVPHKETLDGKIPFDNTQNLKGLFLKYSFSPNGYAFAGLEHNVHALTDTERADVYLKQAEEYCAAGFDGFKMLEGYPCLRKAMGVPLDDKVYDKFYSYLEENRIPVVMHVANPEENWDANKVSKSAKNLGRYCDETYPSKKQLHTEVDGIMRKHPKLRLILAHFGFLTYQIKDAERWLDKYENTMFDLTPGGEQFFNMLGDWDKWHEFFVKYQERILYGTDLYAFPYNNEEDWKTSVLRRPAFIRQFFETDEEHIYVRDKFKGVKMEDSILENIYFKNAEREFGTPKKIDKKYLMEKAEMLLEMPVKSVKYVDEDMRYIIKKMEL